MSGWPTIHAYGQPLKESDPFPFSRCLLRLCNTKNSKEGSWREVVTDCVMTQAFEIKGNIPDINVQYKWVNHNKETSKFGTEILCNHCIL